MKVAWISLGCPKNQVDSERMLALLQGAGMELVAAPEEAEVAVVNTCGFIEPAKQEAIDQILELAELKKAGVLRGIVVAGCLSQRYGAEFAAELPEVDAVLGTGSCMDIVQAVECAGRGERFSSFGALDACPLGGPRILTTPPYTAYLKIAEGCDNRCAYCVIPSLRGRYRSRPMEEILEEAEELAACGVREVIVVAQDITRYGLDLYGERRLARLLERLCRLDFTWVRLLYLYPDEIDDNLIDTIAREEKIVNYIDLPLQHASDRLLRAMNRRGTRAQLLELLQKIRRKIPGVVLRTSFIVGLPGETEAEFEELCDFLQQTQIERAGVFCFSPEEGTVAAEMDGQVEEETKRHRQFLLEQVQSRNLDRFTQSQIGRCLTVLCEGYDEEVGRYVGRSFADAPEIDAAVYFRSRQPHSPGEFVPVRITDAQQADLLGNAEEEV